MEMTTPAPDLNDSQTVRGILMGYEITSPSSGVWALLISEADGTQTAVLVDADCTLRQLTSAFGFPETAVGQPIEFVLDVFGFPTFAGVNPSTGAGPSN